MKRKFALISIISCFFIFSNGANCEENISLQAIYWHAKSEKNKYEILKDHKFSHDIQLIHMGKKEAYDEMTKFMETFINSISKENL